MFDIVCNLPLSSDIFTQAIHPTEPLVSVGLSSGHVETFRLPPAASGGSTESGSPVSEAGYDQIGSVWRTRRHRGSCRRLAFSPDGGETLCSAGVDGIVKLASTETGVVAAKLRIPAQKINNGTIDCDAPTALHFLSPQTLIIGTDLAKLHVYDLREGQPKSPRPSQTHKPHDDNDFISSILPLPASNASTTGFSNKWLSTGGTTLAVTDLRRGVVKQSESQEDELLSSAFVSGLSKRGTNRGEKVAVGTGTGVLTLWENGVWDDQDERIIVDSTFGHGESLDCMASIPESLGLPGKVLAVGVASGAIKYVGVGQRNGVVGESRHDEVEGVLDIGFDVTGRMISSGGPILKVWHEKLGEEQEEEDEEPTGAGLKRLNGGVGSDSDAEDNDSEEDKQREAPRRSNRKRRKRNKDKAGPSNPLGMKASFSGLD